MNSLTNESQYAEALSKVTAIKDLFVDAFGEDKVDLIIPVDKSLDSFIIWKESHRNGTGEEFISSQIFDIIVYWPTVRISNESGASHIIRDLYAKVSITADGILVLRKGFELTRSTYTQAEWNSNYCHSHISGIYTGSFGEPCLGSGPINASVNVLHTTYDLDWWGEFIFELSRYVTVESLAGVPYRKLSNISLTGRTYAVNFQDRSYPPSSFDNSSKTLLKTFVRHLISSYKFDVRCDGIVYIFADDVHNLYLKISRQFILWYNSLEPPPYEKSDLILKGILVPGTIDRGTIYLNCGTNSPSFTESVIVTFKGEPKHLKVIESSEDTRNTLYLLSPKIFYKLLVVLYKYINIKNESEICPL